MRAPYAFSITRVFLPSMTATHELVVPRSMPITFAMSKFLSSGEHAGPWRGDSADREAPRMSPIGYGFELIPLNLRGYIRAWKWPRNRGTDSKIEVFARNVRKIGAH